MSSAERFLQEICSASRTVRAVVRPDPEVPSNVLLAHISGVSDSISMPISYIQGAIKSEEPLAFPSDSSSLNVTFKQAFLGTQEVTLALEKLSLTDLARPVPVKCYDENGNEVPCPQL